MVTLVDIISAPQRRDRIIADCVQRVEAHVANAGGVKGLALRGGLAAFKAARPDAVARATERLLPQFAAALDPLFQQFQASGQRDFAAFLEPRRAEACAAILAITDARAAATSHRTLARVYSRMRGTLQSELNRLLPDLIRSLGRQVK